MPLSQPLFMLLLAEFPTCGRRVSSTASCVSASNSLITKSQYTRSDIECLDKCRDGFPSDCSSAYRDQHGNVFSFSCHPENGFCLNLSERSDFAGRSEGSEQMIKHTRCHKKPIDIFNTPKPFGNIFV